MDHEPRYAIQIGVRIDADVTTYIKEERYCGQSILAIELLLEK